MIKIINTISKDSKVDMILFPEDCFTGLANCDNPEKDIKLGIDLEGKEIIRIRRIAKEINTFVCFGFLELRENSLYDSVTIIDNRGEIIFTHRRIHDGWYGHKVDNSFYKTGSELLKVQTGLGSFVILICGEITDNSLLLKARNLNADFLLFPLLRAYENFSLKWLRDEMKYYKSQIATTKTLTFMINGIDDNETEPSFGGGWVISKNGTILKEMKAFSEGYLIYEAK